MTFILAACLEAPLRPPGHVTSGGPSSFLIPGRYREALDFIYLFASVRMRLSADQAVVLIHALRSRPQNFGLVHAAFWQRAAQAVVQTAAHLVRQVEQR